MKLKMNNMLNDFLENAGDLDEKELNEKLQEFMMKFNMGEIEYEDTPLDKAYEMLEKAENAKSKKQAIKLAKQAFEITDECFDAVLFQSTLEDSILKAEKILADGLDYEKQRLTKEGFFDKDNIGHFYGIFETRPYIRGLYERANNSCTSGKYKIAIELCKEIIRLNNDDNTGARYLLMSLYAMMEDEKEMQKLYKKYPEETFSMLLPFMFLYYKQENYDKAKEYLKKVNNANPNFIKVFKDMKKYTNLFGTETYSIGDASEVIVFMETNTFLLMSSPTIRDFVLECSKKLK